MKPSPQAPDPYQTAAAQTQSNIGTATAQQNLNMVNQNNPLGSLKYTQVGTNPDGTPKYQADTSLSGPMAGIFNGAGGAASTLANSGAGALGGKGLDLSYNGTTAALDALNHSRLDPQWAQNSNHEADTLAARGITAGTPAYDNEMRVFNQGKNDAYNSANLADYQTSSNNALQQYNAPVAALGSLYGTAHGAGSPNFQSTPTSNVAGTNVSGLVEDNYKQQSANVNAQNGQLGGLLGMGLGAVIPGMGGLFNNGGNALPAGYQIPGAVGNTSVGGPNGPMPLGGGFQ